MFSDTGGGAAAPYKARKRRKVIPEGFKNYGQYRRRFRGPAGVVGGKTLRSRTKLAPVVGGNMIGGGLTALPKNKRYAKRGSAPTSEPSGMAEKRSRQYVAAKRRTAKKFRRARKRGF